MRPPFFLLVLAVSAALGLRAQPTLRLEVTTDRELYRDYASNQLLLQVLVSPAAPRPDSSPAPRHLALVVDRSGSMAGTPLETLSNSLPVVVSRLSPTDTLAVITFGSEVETLLPAQLVSQLPDLTTTFANVEASGGSALFDALNQAAAQLRRHATATSVNHLILLTDGPPTKGPRDPSDFAKLAQALLNENITLTTIALGPDSPEDLLATLAQHAAGTFHYIETPSALPAALATAVPAPAPLLALDLALTLDFPPDSEKIKIHGWSPATVSDQSIRIRLPRLTAPLLLHAYARLGPLRSLQDAATLRLTWRDPVDGSSRSLTQALRLDTTTDDDAIRESRRRVLTPTVARLIVTDALSDAIEQLDKQNPRRALSALRDARSALVELNSDFPDPAVAATLRQFETHLDTLASRPLTALDRKLLRSGLLGQFDSPPVKPQKN